MQFRTQIPVPKSSSPIDYNSKVLSVGSCFAENMASKFDYFKFQNQTNPFGIIFNPVSIENLFRRVCKQGFFQEKDLFFHNERWHSFEVHSDLSNSGREELLETLNTYHYYIWNLLDLQEYRKRSDCCQLPQNTAKTIFKRITNC